MDKQRFFDEAAAGFSQDFSPQDMQKIGWMLRRWRLEPGMRVLEPGCGAGQLTLLLAGVLGPHGAVVALDFSREMIDSARRRLSSPRDESAAPVSFLELHLADFHPEAASFDAVIAYRFLPHLDDISAGLEVVAGALRPGRSLFVDHPAGRERINQLHQRAGAAVASDAIPTQQEFTRMLNGAGLELVELIDREEIYHAEARKREPSG